MMRAAIHARRSTEEHQAASVEVQLAEAKRFIEAQGWTWSAEHIYAEAPISRAEFKKRPTLLKLLNAAEEKAFDVIVTRDESRLGGDMIRTCLLIQDMLDAGVQLYYYISGERVRLDDATAKFMVAAKTFAAELEREKISSRTHEHLLTKARRGLNVGGRVFGYDNVERHNGEYRTHVEYAINEAQADIVRRIFDQYSAGLGLRAIAKDLNQRGVLPPRAGRRGTGSWSTSALHAMLRRERYRGVIVWNQREKTYRKGTKVRIQRDANDWIRVDAPELRIVSDDLWFGVQRRINANLTPRAPAGGRPPRYLLSGIARCAECGGPLTAINGKVANAMVKAYTCAYHRDRGTTVCGSSLRRPVESLNSSIVGWIRENVLSQNVVAEALRYVRQLLGARTQVSDVEVAQLRQDADRLRSEIDRLVQALATSTDSPQAVVEAIASRQQRLTALESQLRAAQAAPEAISLQARRLEGEARRSLNDFSRMLDSNPDEARSALLSLLDGPLVCTPVETSEGPRFQIEGTAVIGRIFTVESSVSNSASPRGFEPLLQP